LPSNSGKKRPFGEKGALKDYYSSLSAPGLTAWINLLKGEPTLILLDELPPYFENARSRPIGNSDLSRVTTTALSNLLVAVGRDELSNVCVVISDLKATYEGGSQQILKALEDFRSEAGRSALTLEPVGLNTDELYHILRKRLFEELPPEEEIWEVARSYAQAVRDAKQMDITGASPEKFDQTIKESYPFHFAIRDLYARFRENPGFQQTCGLIRLMRVVTSRLFDEKHGKADKIYLIHAHDLELNDRETLAEVTQINPTLDNAISHDIASNGQAIAEIMDANLGGIDAQDACKLLLVSSLANVPNAVVGLSLSEVVSYLCAPGRDVSRLPKDVLGTLSTKAWYLHSR
jgi:predicted AAA+ superfamily ATPase